MKSAKLPLIRDVKFERPVSKVAPFPMKANVYSKSWVIIRVYFEHVRALGENVVALNPLRN